MLADLLWQIYATAFSSFPQEMGRTFVSTNLKALQLVCLLVAIIKEALRGCLGNELRPPCAPCKFQLLGEGGREGETDLELIEPIKGQSKTPQSCWSKSCTPSTTQLPVKVPSKLKSKGLNGSGVIKSCKWMLKTFLFIYSAAVINVIFEHWPTGKSSLRLPWW